MARKGDNPGGPNMLPQLAAFWVNLDEGGNLNGMPPVELPLDDTRDNPLRLVSIQNGRVQVRNEDGEFYLSNSDLERYKEGIKINLGIEAIKIDGDRIVLTDPLEALDAEEVPALVLPAIRTNPEDPADPANVREKTGGAALDVVEDIKSPDYTSYTHGQKFTWEGKRKIGDTIIQCEVNNGEVSYKDAKGELITWKAIVQLVVDNYPDEWTLDQTEVYIARGPRELIVYHGLNLPKRIEEYAVSNDIHKHVDRIGTIMWKGKKMDFNDIDVEQRKTLNQACETSYIGEQNGRMYIFSKTDGHKTDFNWKIYYAGIIFTQEGKSYLIKDGRVFVFDHADKTGSSRELDSPKERAQIAETLNSLYADELGDQTTFRAVQGRIFCGEKEKVDEITDETKVFQYNPDDLNAGMGWFGKMDLGAITLFRKGNGRIYKEDGTVVENVGVIQEELLRSVKSHPKMYADNAYFTLDRNGRMVIRRGFSLQNIFKSEEKNKEKGLWKAVDTFDKWHGEDFGYSSDEEKNELVAMINSMLKESKAYSDGRNIYILTNDTDFQIIQPSQPTGAYSLMFKRDGKVYVTVAKPGHSPSLRVASFSGENMSWNNEDLSEGDLLELLHGVYPEYGFEMKDDGSEKHLHVTEKDTSSSTSAETTEAPKTPSAKNILSGFELGAEVNFDGEFTVRGFLSKIEEGKVKAKTSEDSSWADDDMHNLARALNQYEYPEKWKADNLCVQFVDGKLVVGEGIPKEYMESFASDLNEKAWPCGSSDRRILWHGEEEELSSNPSVEKIQLLNKEDDRKLHASEYFKKIYFYSTEDGFQSAFSDQSLTYVKGTTITEKENEGQVYTMDINDKTGAAQRVTEITELEAKCAELNELYKGELSSENKCFVVHGDEGKIVLEEVKAESVGPQNTSTPTQAEIARRFAAAEWDDLINDKLNRKGARAKEGRRVKILDGSTDLQTIADYFNAQLPHFRVKEGLIFVPAEDGSRALVAKHVVLASEAPDVDSTSTPDGGTVADSDLTGVGMSEDTKAKDAADRTILERAGLGDWGAAPGSDPAPSSGKKADIGKGIANVLGAIGIDPELGRDRIAAALDETPPARISPERRRSAVEQGRSLFKERFKEYIDVGNGILRKPSDFVTDFNLKPESVSDALLEGEFIDGSSFLVSHSGEASIDDGGEVKIVKPGSKDAKRIINLLRKEAESEDANVLRLLEKNVIAVLSTGSPDFECANAGPGTADQTLQGSLPDGRLFTIIADEDEINISIGQNPGESGENNVDVVAGSLEAALISGLVNKHPGYRKMLRLQASLQNSDVLTKPAGFKKTPARIAAGEVPNDSEGNPIITAEALGEIKATMAERSTRFLKAGMELPKVQTRLVLTQARAAGWRPDSRDHTQDPDFHMDAEAWLRSLSDEERTYRMALVEEVLSAEVSNSAEELEMKAHYVTSGGSLDSQELGRMVDTNTRSTAQVLHNWIKGKDSSSTVAIQPSETADLEGEELAFLNEAGGVSQLIAGNNSATAKILNRWINEPETEDSLSIERTPEQNLELLKSELADIVNGIRGVAPVLVEDNSEALRGQLANVQRQRGRINQVEASMKEKIGALNEAIAAAVPVEEDIRRAANEVVRTAVDSQAYVDMMNLLNLEDVDGTKAAKTQRAILKEKISDLANTDKSDVAAILAVAAEVKQTMNHLSWCMQAVEVNCKAEISDFQADDYIGPSTPEGSPSAEDSYKRRIERAVSKMFEIKRELRTISGRNKSTRPDWRLEDRNPFHKMDEAMQSQARFELVQEYLPAALKNDLELIHRIAFEMSHIDSETNIYSEGSVVNRLNPGSAGRLKQIGLDVTIKQMEWTLFQRDLHSAQRELEFDLMKEKDGRGRVASSEARKAELLAEYAPAYFNDEEREALWQAAVDHLNPGLANQARNAFVRPKSEVEAREYVIENMLHEEIIQEIYDARLDGMDHHDAREHVRETLIERISNEDSAPENIEYAVDYAFAVAEGEESLSRSPGALRRTGEAISSGVETMVNGAEWGRDVLQTGWRKVFGQPDTDHRKVAKYIGLGLAAGGALFAGYKGLAATRSVIELGVRGTAQTAKSVGSLAWKLTKGIPSLPGKLWKGIQTAWSPADITLKDKKGEDYQPLARQEKDGLLKRFGKWGARSAMMLSIPLSSPVYAAYATVRGEGPQVEVTEETVGEGDDAKTVKKEKVVSTGTGIVGWLRGDGPKVLDGYKKVWEKSIHSGPFKNAAAARKKAEAEATKAPADREKSFVSNIAGKLGKAKSFEQLAKEYIPSLKRAYRYSQMHPEWKVKDLAKIAFEDLDAGDVVQAAAAMSGFLPDSAANALGVLGGAAALLTPANEGKQKIYEFKRQWSKGKDHALGLRIAQHEDLDELDLMLDDLTENEFKEANPIFDVEDFTRLDLESPEVQKAMKKSLTQLLGFKPNGGDMIRRVAKARLTRMKNNIVALNDHRDADTQSKDEQAITADLIRFAEFFLDSHNGDERYIMVQGQRNLAQAAEDAEEEAEVVQFDGVAEAKKWKENGTFKEISKYPDLDSDEGELERSKILSAIENVDFDEWEDKYGFIMKADALDNHQERILSSEYIKSNEQKMLKEQLGYLLNGKGEYLFEHKVQEKMKNAIAQLEAVKDKVDEMEDSVAKKIDTMIAIAEFFADEDVIEAIYEENTDEGSKKKAQA